MSFFQLPSPIQPLHSSFLAEKGIELFVKRDDLIHPDVSGNKWRKLNYNLEEARKNGFSKLLTFGGAYSNHILATAISGKLLGFKTIGVIRGERAADLNSTLKQCEGNGMHLHFVSRTDYSRKEEKEMIDTLQTLFGSFYLIPEGGANELAIKGCQDIVNEIEIAFDCISVSAGTGTTATGILQAVPNKKVLVFPALKGVSYLKDEILSHQMTQEKKINLEYFDQYHFGGYAKIDATLVDFIHQFYIEYQLKLDLVYTAKHFFGLFDLIRKGYFAKGTRIVAIHTGGLQGNRGMEQRYNLKLFRS